MMSSADLSDYLDRGGLLVALRDQTGRWDVELLDGIEVKRATKAVEGFLSLVLRVKVPYRLGDGTTHTAVIIMKCMPGEGIQKELVKSMRAFLKEGTYFHEVFPLLRKVSGGKVSLPMPTCYHTKYGGEDDVIYMEDLCARGFRTPAVSCRVKGLDIDHCHLVMEAYGRLHALTIAAERLLPEDTPTWTEAFPELAKDPSLYSPGPGDPPVPFKEMLEKTTDTLLQIAKGLDGLPKEAVTSGKLKTVLQGTWVLMKKLVKSVDVTLKVLTHGDCWMNNSMFRYEEVGDEMKPVEIKFLDFQVARYSHPCLDIVYFMYASLRKPVRRKHMDGLIGMYYDSLERNLRILKYGSPPFTLEKFLSDFHGQYEGFGFIIESFFLPLMLLGEDFAPSDAEKLTPEKYNEFITTGNSASILNRYGSDPYYKSVLDEVIRDLVDNVFPNGLNSPVSPLFAA